MKGRKRLSRRTRIIIAAAVILILIPIVIMIWLPTFIMTGKRQTLDEALKWQSERYDTSFYESIDKTDYTVKSFDGYELHVQLLKNPEPTDKYIARVYRQPLRGAKICAHVFGAWLQLHYLRPAGSRRE